MRTFIRHSLVWAVAATGLLGLSACGGGSSQPSADTAHSTVKKSGGAHHGPVDPSERAPEDMVSAVSAGKGGPPVALRFELRDAPQAGQALEVDLAILPNAPAINRLYAQFTSGEGIDMVDGGSMAAVEKPAQGQVIRHLVRVLPRNDGIYTVNAAVTVDLADGSVTRTFTIPVIVGEGLADVSGKPDNDGKDADAGIAPKAR
jgi:hypothetical protein